MFCESIGLRTHLRSSFVIPTISRTTKRTPTIVQIHIGHIIITNPRSGSALLHVATALVVRFLGQLAVELAVLHLTTALVHRLAGYAASHLLSGAKRGSCEYRKNETNA